MNSSESFIQDYLVISFDLFMYAKITQCKIGSFRNFSRAAHFQVKGHLKRLRYLYFIVHGLFFVKIDILSVFLGKRSILGAIKLYGVCYSLYSDSLRQFT